MRGNKGDTTMTINSPIGERAYQGVTAEELSIGGNVGSIG